MVNVRQFFFNVICDRPCVHLYIYIDAIKLGILEVDGSGRVTSFLEKPSPETTPSRLAVSETVSLCLTLTYEYTYFLPTAVSMFLFIL